MQEVVQGNSGIVARDLVPDIQCRTNEYQVPAGHPRDYSNSNVVTFSCHSIFSTAGDDRARPVERYNHKEIFAVDSLQIANSAGCSKIFGCIQGASRPAQATPSNSCSPAVVAGKAHEIG
jgi:hypothetical protein